MGDHQEASSDRTTQEHESQLPSEWSGSGIVIESGSPNAVDASSEPTPCFLLLDAAVVGAEDAGAGGDREGGGGDGVRFSK